MGREVRRVPAGWIHPVDSHGKLQPMYDETYKQAADQYVQDFLQWAEGQHSDQRESVSAATYQYYWDWAGQPPESQYYRPDWPEADRTHLQMYETCSEGTPISPPMADEETLARWLTDNRASAMGDNVATYEEWLVMIKRGWAISMVVEGGKIMSGVEYASRLQPPTPLRSP